MCRAPSSTTSSKKMGLVKDQLTMVHQPQPDGGAKLEICHIDEDLSFDKGFFLTIRAIQLLKKHAQGKPILVGIAGPSGAGKTVFCQKLIRAALQVRKDMIKRARCVSPINQLI